MTSPAAFRATFTDWRLIKGRKQVQIVFEIPLELADGAYQALGGMPDPAESVWCAIARLDPAKAKDADSAIRSRKQVASEKRLTQQTGICCADPIFWKFLNDERPHGFYIIRNERDAAAAVREICGVESRKSIVPGTEAADKWDRIYSHFSAWRDVPELVP